MRNLECREIEYTSLLTGNCCAAPKHANAQLEFMAWVPHRQATTWVHVSAYTMTVLTTTLHQEINLPRQSPVQHVRRQAVDIWLRVQRGEDTYVTPRLHVLTIPINDLYSYCQLFDITCIFQDTHIITPQAIWKTLNLSRMEGCESIDEL